MKRKNMLLFSLLIWGAVLVICLFVVALSPHFSWSFPDGSDQGKKDWRSDQCEAMHLKSAVREPQNTWSNFAYLLAGLLIIFRAQSALGRSVGVQLCVLFLFSGLYHASVLEPWQTLDIAGVYGVLAAMVVFAVEGMFNRFRNLAPDPIFSWGLIFGTFIAAILMALLRTKIIIFDSTWGFIGMVGILLVLIVLILIFSYAKVTDYQDIISGVGLKADKIWIVLLWLLGVAGVGFFFRLADGKDHLLCCPHSPIQAHATWHVLSALALLISYDFFARLSRSPARIFASPPE